MSDYWREAVSTALEEAGAPDLTTEQLAAVASSIEDCHINYGMAFYSPPPSDRVDAIVREATEPLRAEVKRLEEVTEIFANSVKRRRGAREVYIERGSVMYR